MPLGLFAAAALSPLLLIGLGIAWGGVWPWLAVLWMGFATVVLDILLLWVAGDGDAAEFPAADALLVILALSALAALPLLTWAVAGSSELGLAQRLALFLAGGLWFGQVGHPAAHELIHRPRPLFSLGVALYSALLFGHHASAHRLVHHRFVATDQDPNSAPAGEGLYAFIRRAWPASFRAGWQAERALRARAGSRRRPSPYAAYIAIALMGLSLAAALAGPTGTLVWLGFGLHFGFQVLLSDYLQHYGLRRGLRPDGTPVPVGPGHSWNTPHWFSGAMMLNAPRHSDHHAHPDRPFPALRLPPKAPLLPWPLPLAGALALHPRLWRRRMAPLLASLAAADPGPEPGQQAPQVAGSLDKGQQAR